MDKHDFRSNTIESVKKKIADERINRISTSKTYKKAIKILNFTGTGLITITVGFSLIGAGLLSTVVAAPAVLGLEITACLSGCSLLVGKYILKKLEKSLMKHNKIIVLSDAKLKTINQCISKSLEDDAISDKEFNAILSELTNFKAEMKEIKLNSNKNLGK